MAVPLVSANDEFTVVPSTAIDRVPVGVDVTELDPEATVIVTTSFAPELGEVVAALRVVFEEVFEDVLVGVGQAEKRL